MTTSSCYSRIDLYVTKPPKEEIPRKKQKRLSGLSNLSWSCILKQDDHEGTLRHIIICDQTELLCI